MKRFTVRVRVMLWFTLMMAVILAIAVVFVSIMAKDASGGNAERQLIDAVSYNVDELDYDNGLLDVDEFDVYRAGVFIEVYDANGKLLAGAKVISFVGDDEFVPALVRRVNVDGEQYLVLDQFAESPEGGVWFRGVTSAENGNDVVRVLAKLLIILLPVLIGLTLLGGWFIAGRAMRPVRRITEAANAISGGDDLSARINLPHGRDEIHRLADTFDRMFERLERSFQAEKQFASDASHELRTPTSVILAECELAQRTAKTTQDYEESLAVIKRQADSMTEIISRLMRSARLAQGTEALCLQMQDVSALVSACCEDAAIACVDTCISTDIAQDVVAKVDASLFTSLVRNLLDNAVKYGGEQITVSLHSVQSGELELCVRDNGAGIAKDDLDKIWQRFWRADDARTQGEGSGLGLYLVRQMAQTLGGTVTCESAPDVGTAFTFTFRANQSDVDAEQPTANAAKKHKVRAPKEPKVRTPKELKVRTPKEPKVRAPKEPKVRAPKEPKVRAPKEPKVRTPKEPKVRAPKEPKSDAVKN